MDKITPEFIAKSVAEKIKPGKSDSEYDLTTDSIKNALLEYFEHLSFFFRASLIHGHINVTLLMCAIILLIKNKNGATDKSDNQRGIAISSLLLKIFDWIVLILFDKELVTDDNQFGFKEGSSATMCTYIAVEVINNFIKNGSTVYACLLDYRKAFDYVNHVKMFTILIERNINVIFIRLMIFMYLTQSCYIKWQQTRSYSFSVTNGSRQGAVFSPRGGFATYLDPMIQSLRDSGHGLKIGEFWYGGLAFADDGILLSTTISGLQDMVDICSKHAEENDLVFSTHEDPEKSKTMCIAFKQKVTRDKLPDVYLNGDVLPWKESVNHLGATLHSDGTMDHDIDQKRGVFISTNYSLNQEFDFCTTDVRLRMLHLYNMHFTNCRLWSFESQKFDKLCR